MIYDDFYEDIPSSDDGTDEQELPVGVPTLRRDKNTCPFCLKQKVNTHTHIPKCYIKACKRERVYPFCTCPTHKGMETHSAHEVPSKRRRMSTCSSTEDNPIDNPFSPIPHCNIDIQSDEKNEQLSFETSTPTENSTQGENGSENELGRVRTCIGRLVQCLHQCKNHITKFSIEIIIKQEHSKELHLFICTPNVLSSPSERKQIQEMIEGYVSQDEIVIGESMYGGSYSNPNCEAILVRNDIKVKKPPTRSPKVDSTSCLFYCSIKHLLEHISNVSENQWAHKILMHTPSNNQTQNSSGKFLFLLIDRSTICYSHHLKEC